MAKRKKTTLFPRKPVQLYEVTHMYLSAERRPGETYDDAIARLLGIPKKRRR